MTASSKSEIPNKLAKLERALFLGFNLMNLQCVELIVLLEFNALFFYVTKTVLVSPKWFWSDQIDWA